MKDTAHQQSDTSCQSSSSYPRQTLAINARRRCPPRGDTLTSSSSATTASSSATASLTSGICLPPILPTLNSFASGYAQQRQTVRMNAAAVHAQELAQHQQRQSQSQQQQQQPQYIKRDEEIQPRRPIYTHNHSNDVHHRQRNNSTPQASPVQLAPLALANYSPGGGSITSSDARTVPPSIFSTTPYSPEPPLPSSSSGSVFDHPEHQQPHSAGSVPGSFRQSSFPPPAPLQTFPPNQSYSSAGGSLWRAPPPHSHPPRQYQPHIAGINTNFPPPPSSSSLSSFSGPSTNNNNNTTSSSRSGTYPLLSPFSTISPPSGISVPLGTQTYEVDSGLLLSNTSSGGIGSSGPVAAGDILPPVQPGYTRYFIGPNGEYVGATDSSGQTLFPTPISSGSPLIMPSRKGPKSTEGEEELIQMSLDGQKPKRKQVKNACTNCQKACKKCDDNRPCHRCTKYGYQATCVNSPRHARKKVPIGIKRGPYKGRKTGGHTRTRSGDITTGGESSGYSEAGSPEKIQAGDLESEDGNTQRQPYILPSAPITIGDHLDQLQQNGNQLHWGSDTVGDAMRTTRVNSSRGWKQMNHPGQPPSQHLAHYAPPQAAPYLPMGTYAGDGHQHSMEGHPDPGVGMGYPPLMNPISYNPQHQQLHPDERFFSRNNNSPDQPYYVQLGQTIDPSSVPSHASTQTGLSGYYHQMPQPSHSRDGPVQMMTFKRNSQSQLQGEDYSPESEEEVEQKKITPLSPFVNASGGRAQRAPEPRSPIALVEHHDGASSMHLPSPSSPVVMRERDQTN